MKINKDFSILFNQSDIALKYKEHSVVNALVNCESVLVRVTDLKCANLKETQMKK